MGHYLVGLVGEKNYQPAIKSSKVGDRVTLSAEPENPHDPRAVVVFGSSGAILGYLPKGGWLTRVIIDEGKKPAARIKAINGDSSSGKLGIVVEVAMGGEAINPIREASSRPPSASEIGGHLGSFVRGLLKGFKR